MKKLNKVKNKLKKFYEYIVKNIVDLLVLIAMIIIGVNSSIINLNFGMYVVALEFIILAYVLSKKGCSDKS